MTEDPRVGGGVCVLNFHFPRSPAPRAQSQNRTHMTSTVGHCGPAGITSKLAIILGLILGVTVKQTQRSSVAAAMAEEGAAAEETRL